MKTKSKHSVNLSLQVIPLNTEAAYPIIDRAFESIQASGVRCEVQPFATLLEGDWDRLMASVEGAKDAALAAGAEELLLNVQIHLKKDADVHWEDKTAKYRVPKVSPRPDNQ